MSVERLTQAGRVKHERSNIDGRVHLPASSWLPGFTADGTVELLLTPTYASFVKLIECRCWAISEFVV